jgi:polysaccharide deacetylase 2 family uncharacterized protein YibQ
MVRRRRSTKGSRVPLLLGAIATGALLLFLAGEMLAWIRSDSGRLVVWRHLHMGSRAHAVRIVGALIEHGLDRAGIGRDSIESRVESGNGPSLRWRVTLPPDGAPLQVNQLVTHAVESGGAAVLSGRERTDKDGSLVVTLVIGVPGRPTHALEIVRPYRAEEPERVVRVAVLLFASTEDEPLLVAACARPEVFAVAVTPTGAAKPPALRAAREHHRETVLFMPMEPENYPRVNPGPATLLVSMPAGKIEQALRREIELARPVVAVANLMGSFATQDEPFMTAVYRELRHEDLPFLHVGAVPRAVCRPLAARVGASYEEPDAMIDAEARHGDAESLDRAWAECLERAHEREQALVLVRVTAASAPWLERAFAPRTLAGVELVPLSALLRRPGSSQ